MIIKVLIPTIDANTFQKILDNYNKLKEANENPLQRLNRAEGGFQIELPQDKWDIDPYFGFPDANDKIRQVRWSNGTLVSGLHRGFTLKQYMLLYDSLVVALPPGSVVLEN